MVTTTLLLLAEDEWIIQDLLNTTLSEAGFAVTVVVNRTQALAELDGNAGRFRGVITDVKLGVGPDGWDVGRRARELVPDMPVVYMSGDSAQHWASKGVPNSVMVAKPF